MINKFSESDKTVLYFCSNRLKEYSDALATLADEADNIDIEYELLDLLVKVVAVVRDARQLVEVKSSGKTEELLHVYGQYQPEDIVMIRGDKFALLKLAIQIKDSLKLMMPTKDTYLVSDQSSYNLYVIPETVKDVVDMVLPYSNDEGLTDEEKEQLSSLADKLKTL